MGPEKTTLMILKVDLDCDRCYQKVKRTLCRFPQIRDQMYNDKENTVMIKVVCCSPEKIRDKICAKGGRSIKGIQIVEAKPPPPPAAGGGAKPPKPAPAPPAGGDSAPPPAEKPKDKAAPPPAEKPKDKAPPPAEKPKDKPQGPPPSDKIQKNGSKNGSGPKPEQQGKPPEKQAQAPPPEKQAQAPAKPDSKPPAPAPAPQQSMPPQAMMQSMQMGVPGYPPPPGIYPVNMHWGPFYDGQPAGIYPPQPVHMMGDPYGYYGSGSGGWNSRPPTAYCSNQSDYFSDENPQACVIM